MIQNLENKALVHLTEQPIGKYEWTSISDSSSSVRLKPDKEHIDNVIGIEDR